MCRSQKGCVRIRHDANFYLLQHRGKAALAGKPVHELATPENRQNFWRYTSANHYSTEREDLQRQVAGLRTVHSAKHFDGVSTNRIATIESGFGYHPCRIA